MCGIVGYVGPREAEPILVDGLRRLEYRGYDSAGVATVTGSRLHLRKKAGRVADLSSYLKTQPAPGCIGIATPVGRLTAQRPTPMHIPMSRARRPGGRSRSQWRHRKLFAAQTRTSGRRLRIPQRHRLRGHRPSDRPNRNRTLSTPSAKCFPCSRGLMALRSSAPGTRSIVGARLGSPLVLGIGDEEYFLASDPAALVGQTDHVVYLEDRQMAVISSTAGKSSTIAASRSRPTSIPSIGTRGRPTGPRFRITCSRRFTSSPRQSKTPCAAGSATADATAHFGGLNLDAQQFDPCERIVLTGCGTSYHAGSGRRISVRGISPGCRSKSNTPASFAIATRRSITTPSSSRSRSPAKPPTRSRPCENPSGRAIPRWRFAMLSAPASPARPMAASTCTRVRKSASPAPRHSRRR